MTITGVVILPGLCPAETEPLPFLSNASYLGVAKVCCFIGALMFA